MSSIWHACSKPCAAFKELKRSHLGELVRCHRQDKVHRVLPRHASHYNERSGWVEDLGFASEWYSRSSVMDARLPETEALNTAASLRRGASRPLASGAAPPASLCSPRSHGEIPVRRLLRLSCVQRLGGSSVISRRTRPFLARLASAWPSLASLDSPSNPRGPGWEATPKASYL